MEALHSLWSCRFSTSVVMLGRYAPRLLAGCIVQSEKRLEEIAQTLLQSLSGLLLRIF